MTEQERELAKKAVEDSVKGLMNGVLGNFSFAPVAEELIKYIADREIKSGVDDIDRISNLEHPANKVEKDEWFVEANAHHAM